MVQIAHASISENGDSGRNGKAKKGDQTKKEVCIRNWYSKPWDFVLRPKDSKVAQNIAKYAKQIADNDNVGYDQSKRNTLYEEWKKSKDFTKVPLCACDCSSFSTCCAIASGVPIDYGTNAPVTANMEKRFGDTGCFEILKDKKYTTLSDYLKTGDILVKSGSHTVVVISDGSKAEEKKNTSFSTKIPAPTLSYGCKGEEVKKLQECLNSLAFLGKNGTNLVVDSVFGKNTEYALSCFQSKYGLVRDGIYGKKSYAKMSEIIG